MNKGLALLKRATQYASSPQVRDSVLGVAVYEEALDKAGRKLWAAKSETAKRANSTSPKKRTKEK